MRYFIYAPITNNPKYFSISCRIFILLSSYSNKNTMKSPIIVPKTNAINLFITLLVCTKFSGNIDLCITCYLNIICLSYSFYFFSNTFGISFDISLVLSGFLSYTLMLIICFTRDTCIYLARP